MNPVAPRSILYVETYPTGSHQRTVELICRHSVHDVRVVSAWRDEWRWISGAAHHDLARKIKAMSPSVRRPDLILVSGPINLPGLIASLPKDLRDVPLVTYFHESQWTYPNPPTEILPYLLGHIDSAVLSDELWFNSEFHRSVFFDHVFNSSMARMRSLAREFVDRCSEQSRVVYPPVELDFTQSDSPARRRPAAIAWVARWEAEKRPDLFVRAITRLRNRGVDVNLILLGAGSGPSKDVDQNFSEISDLIQIQGPLAAREDYEVALAQADIVVSTAEHEFFGIAILEAAQAGAVPVLPRDLAYPETIPSAWFYRAGDTNDLERVLEHVIRTSPGSRTSQSDARRFIPAKTVAAFDSAVDSVVMNQDAGNRI